MTSANIDTNVVVQQSVAAEGGGDLLALPRRVPMDDLVPPVSIKPPPLSLAESIISLAGLWEMDILEQEALVGSWWLEENIGFLFGQQGKGKSWIGLYLAHCLAEGRDCGPWSIPKARKVLYMDGEMSMSAIRQRSKALGLNPYAPLYLLSRKYRVGKRRGASFNLADPNVQKELLELCEREKIKVLILDNLSCLLSGVSENEADAWQPVLDFLLEMQSLGVSICIVHHAGRSGAHMRGTSRREDAADWVMHVTPSGDDDERPDEGYKTKFVTEFTKGRTGIGKDEGPWEWRFETPAEGAVTTVRWSLLSKLKVFLRLIEEDGLELCSEIAEEMGLSKGAVSKLAQKAKAQKLIAIEGSGNQRRYTSITVPKLS